MTVKILFILLMIAVLILFVFMASAIALLFHIYGEDPAHNNSVNVPRGTTMGATRTTNISRTGKK